jgi:hypothetical protein
MGRHFNHTPSGLPHRDGRACAGCLLLLAVAACTVRDSMAPAVELSVSDVYAETAATCDFAYQCTQTVRYVTTDLTSGRNVPGEVAITGPGTHPSTAMSGPLGVGDFTWTFAAEPGTRRIMVCPNVATPIESRCGTMDVNIGP